MTYKPEVTVGWRRAIATLEATQILYRENIELLELENQRLRVRAAGQDELIKELESQLTRRAAPRKRVVEVAPF